MHAKLVPHFNADSLRKVLYPQREMPHDGHMPTETDNTNANASHINALFANPQDNPAQPDTIQARARRPTKETHPPARPPAPNNQPNAWNNLDRRQPPPAAPTYTHPVIAVPTPAQKVIADQFKEKQCQQLHAERAKQTDVDTQLESMQKAIAAQKAELDSLKTLAENNKTTLTTKIDKTAQNKATKDQEMED